MKVLQALLSANEEVEEAWGSSVAGSKECNANSTSGKLCATFGIEKSTIFCPFSYSSSELASQEARNIGKLRNFFDDAQVSVIDPLMLVTILLYHPSATMRLEAFKLGCQILRDRNDVLQDAYRRHARDGMHLQRAMGYQFSHFFVAYKKATVTNTEMDMMAEMLKLIQQLCEGHNERLQDFLGEDYTEEQHNIFSVKTIDDDDDDNEKEEDDEDDDGDGQPNNIVQWVSQMLQLALDNMNDSQDWQASMTGREKQYTLIQQLFDTAAELIQGPNMNNQQLLLEIGVCMDVNRLWKIVHRDEFFFRSLIQDNEDLADAWMELLQCMRLAEISALRFVLSLLEEKPLDQDDADFAEQQTAVIYSKTYTIKRMIEEMKPKTLCDKIITHWNLSSEVDDPRFRIPPKVGGDDDDDGELNTAEPILRPKREIESGGYPLQEQKDHCLEVCAMSYSVFMAVYHAPEAKSSDFKNIKVERPELPDGMPPYDISSYPMWTQMKTKVFDSFIERVTTYHHEKYLHFLFGQVEIVRGSRLQRLFFFVPPAIRMLKNQLLIHQWQEGCLLQVERSSPEAQVSDFADRVNDEYITFVQHQYFLLQKPWPFNMVGEVINMCINTTMVTTVVLNTVMVVVYTGSYSHHSILNTEVHYTSLLYVILLTVFAGIHFGLSLIWLFFYILAYSKWIIDTQTEEWREENLRDQNELNNPLFRLQLQSGIFLSDKKLMYTFFLLVCSFLGLYVNFLFNAVNTLDLCMNIPILQKVTEAITGSAESVVGTMFLSFCIQYIFVAIGFMTFANGYGFADMDTSQCSTLVECLMGHFDYGFRSAPVWGSARLGAVRFLFDYSYNLIVILIMAAIISGIIIDNFAELREAQQAVDEAMVSQCFVCSLSKSELERSGVKFEHHILHDHYQWAYARFLLYIAETSEQNLTGPEDYVKLKIAENSTVFFPVGRCIAMEASDAGADHLERPVRVKDMDEFKANLKDVAGNTEDMKKADGLFKMELADLRENVQGSTAKVQVLQALLAAGDDDDKKKKKKKG